jgi:hypothetical protein
VKPEGLISRIIKRIEPDPPREPEPSEFKKSGGWSNDRPSVGGAHSLSPDESAEAHRAGAEALVEMARQKDNNPGGPLYDVHL